MPSNYDPRINQVSDTEAVEILNGMRNEINGVVSDMPMHNQTLGDYCAGDLISLIKNAKQSV